jgi:hypothetical protein
MIPLYVLGYYFLLYPVVRTLVGKIFKVEIIFVLCRQAFKNENYKILTLIVKKLFNIICLFVF